MTLNDILSIVQTSCPNALLFQEDDGNICISLGVATDKNGNVILPQNENIWTQIVRDAGRK